MTKTVLFLCVGNSARSQMAEGITRAMAPDGVHVLSAGSLPAGLNRFAVEVLGELDIDIRHNQSKAVTTIDLDQVDTVITLCEAEVCPALPGGTERLHWPLPDPAAANGVDQERLRVFRQVRDELRTRIESWLAGLGASTRAG